MQNKKVQFRDLGEVDYKECWDFQEKIFNETVLIKRSNRDLKEPLPTPNYLFFVEHPHVYTLGKRVILPICWWTKKHWQTKVPPFIRLTEG